MTFEIGDKVRSPNGLKGEIVDILLLSKRVAVRYEGTKLRDIFHPQVLVREEDWIDEPNASHI